MAKIMLALGVVLQGSKSYANSWPSRQPFYEYASELLEHIRQCDFRGAIIGQNCDGVTLMLVGDETSSRLIGVHPEDPRGSIYVFVDRGAPPDLGTYRPQKAITARTLMEASYASVRAQLDLDRHLNDRLSDKKLFQDRIYRDYGDRYAEGRRSLHAPPTPDERNRPN